MHIDIRARFPLLSSERDLIVDRLTRAVSRFSARIRSLVVVGEDANGPRHGPDDRSARLVAVLNDGRLVQVSRRADSLGRAVATLIPVLRRQLVRELSPAFVRR